MVMHHWCCNVSNSNKMFYHLSELSLRKDRRREATANTSQDTLSQVARRIVRVIQMIILIMKIDEDDK